MVHTPISDLLRLLAVPVFGWAAWRNIETRRVPNRMWYPLTALTVVLLAWDGLTAMQSSPLGRRWFLFQVAVSLLFVAPLVIAFWWFRVFGGADAKAFLVVAVLFPTYPIYHLGNGVFPVQQTVLGVFSLTILTNTVLVGALYPAALFVRNLLAGQLSSAMIVGRVVPWDEISKTHGKLLETPEGITRNGVDLDAIRMYLRWRGITLADLRERAHNLRDPATVPDEPNPPTDGTVTGEALTDGGRDSAAAESRLNRGESDGGEVVERHATLESSGYEDPWGAARFLADIDHDAYGTTPTQLREGLEVLVTEEETWVSPGIPFIVPMFVGLVVAFGYGDLLSGLLGVLGLATL